MKRKSTGKRARFEVFKRDNFTCQYCGAQPPDVVLVVDHITPVSEGGTDETTNLVTACEACNQGKAAKQLTHVEVRPDSALLYRETEQEIAELKRYREAKERRDLLIQEIAWDLSHDWGEVLGAKPAWHVVLGFLEHYPPESVEEALNITLRQVLRGSVEFPGVSWVKYTWGVLRAMKDE